jgi:hypothetical protein
MIVATVRLVAEHRRVETDQAEHDLLPPHPAEAAAAPRSFLLDRSNEVTEGLDDLEPTERTDESVDG